MRRYRFLALIICLQAAQEIATLALELQSMRTWLAVKEISTEEETLKQASAALIPTECFS